LGWYGGMARSRLQALGVAAPPFPYPAATEPLPAGGEERIERAKVLASAGLGKEAEAELEDASRAAGKDPAAAERVAATAHALGLHRAAYALANARLWSRAVDQRSPTSLALLFPRAHAAALTRAAEAVNLDPYFAWAIMRRESRFDPAARSFARAHGLMQLLVPTAKKIALLSGEPEPEQHDLYDPARTLPLATWYLAELAGRFNHLALAAAAYNGGPQPVAGWVEARRDVPLDLFVELIPFRETRGYVKGVLGDYFSYRALWGEPLRPPSLSLVPARGGATF
ncbi:MAG: lytic transglycosylase domain-containing protein, partial [Myxococcales bacterium]